MKLHHTFTVHGREVITLDNSLAARRYAEQRFAREHGPANVAIKWEPKPEGGIMLTWQDPQLGGKDFRTSAYSIEDVAVDE